MTEAKLIQGAAPPANPSGGKQQQQQPGDGHLQEAFAGDMEVACLEALGSSVPAIAAALSAAETVSVSAMEEAAAVVLQAINLAVPAFARHAAAALCIQGKMQYEVSLVIPTVTATGVNCYGCGFGSWQKAPWARCRVETQAEGEEVEELCRVKQLLTLPLVYRCPIFTPSSMRVAAMLTSLKAA